MTNCIQVKTAEGGLDLIDLHTTERVQYLTADEVEMLDSIDNHDYLLESAIEQDYWALEEEPTLDLTDDLPF